MSARRVTRRRVRLIGTACASLLLVATGCGADEPAPSPTSPPPPSASGEPAPQPPPPPTGVQGTIATDLRIPWAIAFLPDGTALVTEREGRIVRVGPERDGDGLAVSEVQTIEVNPAGEGGLLGIAVSPQYETDELIYVYYTTGQDNRIARLRLGEQPEPVLTGIPRGTNHNGGRLGFGPDGYLYATTGDSGQPDRAQDRDSLAGKVLRMTPEGQPAPGNPFDSHVWAYGLRNPQGLAWDASQRLWVTEFGQDQWDEVNRIEPGGNYGWPIVEGEADDDRFVNPAVVWRPAEASCSGAAVAGDTLYVACLRGQRMWAMQLTGSGTMLGAPEPLLVEEYGRLRAVVVAPDGSLWVSTSNHDNRLRRDPHPDDDRIIQFGVAGSAGRA